MSFDRAEIWIGLTIIVLLAIDVLLEWKMVYGVYPWEGTGGS